MSIEMPGNTMALLATARGKILDLGPGTGVLLEHFRAEQITEGYGPEPAIDMYPVLHKNIEKAGLKGKYHVLECGAEPDSLIPALAQAGVLGKAGLGGEGIFDTILCTRVLCGVPQPHETIKTLYRLLKPGGRMLVCEHVTSPWPTKGSVFGWVVQKALMIVGWKFWMAGCTINRDTLGMLTSAPGHGEKWGEVDVAYASTWHPLPFIVGTFTKKK
jgi:SAM-dependent methyltransferase